MSDSLLYKQNEYLLQDLKFADFINIFNVGIPRSEFKNNANSKYKIEKLTDDKVYLNKENFVKYFLDNLKENSPNYWNLVDRAKHDYDFCNKYTTNEIDTFEIIAINYDNVFLDSPLSLSEKQKNIQLLYETKGQIKASAVEDIKYRMEHREAEKIPIIPDFDTIVTPKLYDIYKKYIRGGYSCEQVWVEGSRHAGRSTWASTLIIKEIIEHADVNAVVLTKNHNTIMDTVYAQVEMAISLMNMKDFFEGTKNPPIIRYKPTGQKIIFKGVTNNESLKGLTSDSVDNPYKILWIDEANKMKNARELEDTLSSFKRGAKQLVILTFNTPVSKRHWINILKRQKDDSRVLVHCTYKDLLNFRPELLESQLSLIKFCEENNPTLYKSMYEGQELYEGGGVFNNIEVREISNYEISQFDYNDIRCGLDFGTSERHPQVMVKLCFNKKKGEILFFDEIWITEDLSCNEFSNIIKQKQFNKFKFEDKLIDIHIIADSKELTQINTYIRDLGIANMTSAHKFNGITLNGISFLKQYRLIFDKNRCPNTLKQFIDFSYIEKEDSLGETYYSEDEPQEENDDAIDATIYSLNREIKALVKDAKEDEKYF